MATLRTISKTQRVLKEQRHQAPRMLQVQHHQTTRSLQVPRHQATRMLQQRLTWKLHQVGFWILVVIQENRWFEVKVGKITQVLENCSSELDYMQAPKRDGIKCPKGFSVHCWHVTSVANVTWKPLVIQYLHLRSIDFRVSFWIFPPTDFSKRLG